MALGRTTLLGDACWVCGIRFKNSVPPGPAMREDHHIFPRNAGGTDGPQASLCDRHHACLHKIAQRLQTKKGFKDLLVGETQLGAKRLLWLASCVVKAEAAAEGDPNKQFRNGVMLNAAETQMMLRLQSVYKNRSRSDLFRAGLYLLYQKHFK